MDILQALNKRHLHATGKLRHGRWYIRLERHYAYSPSMHAIAWLDPVPDHQMFYIAKDIEIDDCFARNNPEAAAAWASDYLDDQYRKELERRGLSE